MAASGFTPISLYYSTTAAAAPTAGNLTNGELAINITDGKLYYKDNAGVVQLLASKAALTSVDSISFGTTGLTPATATTGAVSVAGTLVVANGGTGATTAPTARTNLGATTLGGNLFTITNPSAITFPRFNADNTVSALNASDFRTAIGSTTLGGNLFTITNPSAITFPRFNADNTVSALSAADFRTAIGAGTGAGTVTGVTATSPVASSGGTAPVISLSAGYGDTLNPYASKTANFFLAAPNGAAGVPTFRAVVAADIPTLNQNTTGTASNVTGTVAIANGGTGATTRQDAMDALAGAVTSGQYLRGNGTDVVMSAIQAADVPTLNQNTTGSSGSCTGNAATATAAAGSGFYTQTTASEGQIGANFSGQNPVYLYNNSTAWGIYSASGGSLISYARSTGAVTTPALTNTQTSSLGVGTSPSGTTGEIRATNNITAYFSDERLKTKIGNIENALDKVKQIETMVYHANEAAVALGYDASVIEVGVTAQSVQKVQPQTVAPAPIDAKYLTVRYERLVPLLIEAIKELEAQVAELKARG